MTVDKPHFSHSAPPYSHSLRLTFAYDGKDIRLVRVVRVAMIAPPVVTPPPHERQSGHWLEVRDDKDEVIYHRPVHDPLRSDVESFGDKPGDPIRRTPTARQRGEFEVIVPDLPQARQFQLRIEAPSRAAEHSRDLKASTVPRESLVTRYSFEELRRAAQQR